MPEEMNRLLRDYFDRKISRRDFIRKAMSAAGGFVAAETLLERFARDQAYGGEVDPKDPTIRVGSCRVSRQNPPNRWAIRLGRRRRANIAP